MSAAIVALPEPAQLPAIPWRDPHTVSPARLSEFISALEKQCEQQPQSADLRTCLGIAYAMNYEVYKSMDALEAAIHMQPDHFFAQLKYGELHYRLRGLVVAEQETLKALDFAKNAWELSLARKQLSAIRKLLHAGVMRPEWTKPLLIPASIFAIGAFLLCMTQVWR